MELPKTEAELDALITSKINKKIDLIYNYSFQSVTEDVQEWFKIKDVILLSNLHYIRNQKDAYINSNDSNDKAHDRKTNSHCTIK